MKYTPYSFYLERKVHVDGNERSIQEVVDDLKKGKIEVLSVIPTEGHQSIESGGGLGKTHYLRAIQERIGFEGWKKKPGTENLEWDTYVEKRLEEISSQSSEKPLTEEEERDIRRINSFRIYDLSALENQTEFAFLRHLYYVLSFFMPAEFEPFDKIIRDYAMLPGTRQISDLTERAKNTFREIVSTLSFKNFKQPPIVFIDTWEIFQKSGGIDLEGLKKVIETQVEMLSKTGVRFVLAGRLPIPKLEHIDKWQSVSIAPFKDEEIRRYLTTVFQSEATYCAWLEGKYRQDYRPEHMQKITDGLPVLIGAVSDLLFTQHGKNGDRAEKTWEDLMKMTSRNDFEDFFTRSENISKFGHSYFRVALQLMVVAKHRLDAQLFSKLIEINAEEVAEHFNAIRKSALVKNYLPYLPPVPSQKDEPAKSAEITRNYRAYLKVLIKKRYCRLHDIVYDILHDKHWQKADPFGEHRKVILSKITRYYEEELLNEESDHIFKDIYLLEYMQYLFDQEWGKAKTAVSPFIRHFYLEVIDEQDASYAERYLKIGEGFLKAANKGDASPFHKAEIHFLRIGYILTYRNKVYENYETAVIEKIDEIKQIINSEDFNQLKPQEKGMVEGRLAVFLGEFMVWQSNYDGAIDSLLKAQRCFLQTNERHWIIWANHIIGFAYQRKGDMDLAREWTVKTLTSALNFCLKLEPKTIEHILISRAVLRMLSNLAANYRFTGKLNQGKIYGENALYFIQYLGLPAREAFRVSLNLALFYIYTYTELGANLLLDYSKEKAELITDPLLDKRLKYMESLKEFRKTPVALMPNLYREETLFEKIRETNQNSYYQEALYKAKSIISDAVQAPTGAQTKTPAGAHTGKKNKPGGSREVAEAYFLRGKLNWMSWNIDTEKPYWDEAEKDFRLCLENSAGFQYTEMEAIEILYTLMYFRQRITEKVFKEDANTWKKKKESWKKEFEQRTLLLQAQKIVYLDPSAKYHITAGDELFDEFYDWFDPDPDLTYEKMKLDAGNRLEQMNSAIGHYLEAVNYASDFSENRKYHALQVLAERLKVVANLKEEIAQKLATGEVFKKTLYAFLTTFLQENPLLDLIREHPGFPKQEPFKIFLCDLIDAARFAVAGNSESEEADKLRRRVQHYTQTQQTYYAQLVQRFITDRHRQEYEKNGAPQELIFCLFQEAYVYLLLNFESSARRCIEEARQILKNHPDDLLLKAVVDIGEATIDYRTNEFWNMEKFVAGELAHFRTAFETNRPGKLRSAEKAYSQAIEVLKNAENKLDKRYLKLLAEAYFRRGELNLLLENFELSITDLKKAVDISGKKFDGDELDPYRLMDALQSIATTYYFWKYDYLEKAEKQRSEENEQLRREFESMVVEKRKEIIHNFRDQEKLGNEATRYDRLYPVVMGKLWLIKGDNLFSKYYKLKNYEGVFEVFESRNGPAGEENWQKRLDVIEMFRAYLEACDWMSDEERRGVNFNNTFLELTRRILMIPDAETLGIMRENLNFLWLNYKYLKDKNREFYALNDMLELNIIKLKAKQTSKP
jgi:hypothetical protein